jgi:hypothetical protein
LIVNIYLLYRTNIHRTPLLSFERFTFDHEQSKRLEELLTLNSNRLLCEPDMPKKTALIAIKKAARSLRTTY